MQWQCVEADNADVMGLALLAVGKKHSPTVSIWPRGSQQQKGSPWLVLAHIARPAIYFGGSQTLGTDVLVGI